MAEESTAKSYERRVVVACRIMEPELEYLRREDESLDISYLEQALHLTPEKLAPLVQKRVDEAAARGFGVVLGYGLCSNGIVGVTAGPGGLTVPRCHDCISLFLGSTSAYNTGLKSHPGTFYLPQGWMKERLDPLSIIEDNYTPRVGRESALWCMNQELKHYSRIALVDTGVEYPVHLRRRVRENAKLLNKEYVEIKSGLDYFRKLLRGPCDREDFISLKPGEKVLQSMFIGRDKTAGVTQEIPIEPRSPESHGPADGR